MYIFWRHGQFPYCLGAEMVPREASASAASDIPKRDAQASGFATKDSDGLYRGGWVTPFLYLPDHLGQDLLARLKDLKAERQAAVDAECDCKLRELMSAYGAEHIVKEKS